MTFKGVVSFFVFLVLAPTAFAADDIKPLILADVPAAVQKTITSHIGNGQLGDIDKTNEDGEIVFEASFTPKIGEERDFSVADDGTLLSVEVTLTEAPAAVQKTIQTEASGWELESIDKNLDDTEISYDVVVTKAGNEKQFTVAEDGDVLSENVALAATPTAVQATIKTQVADGSLKSVDEIFEPDGNSFNVTAAAKNGSRKAFSVSAAGQLLSEEVPLEKTPPGARKTIEAKIVGGKILRIDKSLVEKKGGVLPYEVQGRKDGKPFDFSVGPRGRFLGMNE